MDMEWPCRWPNKRLQWGTSPHVGHSKCYGRKSCLQYCVQKRAEISTDFVINHFGYGKCISTMSTQRKNSLFGGSAEKKGAKVSRGLIVVYKRTRPSLLTRKAGFLPIPFTSPSMTYYPREVKPFFIWIHYALLAFFVHSMHAGEILIIDGTPRHCGQVHVDIIRVLHVLDSNARSRRPSSMISLVVDLTRRLRLFQFKRVMTQQNALEINASPLKPKSTLLSWKI